MTVPFEGVEKRLIVQFANFNPRLLTPQKWQRYLDFANCEIVSTIESDGQTIHLLSESTLVCWDSGFLMKTCGRTTPFAALGQMLGLPVTPNQPTPSSSVMSTVTSTPATEDLQTASSAEPIDTISAEIQWMAYSRLEFIHPEFQFYPHRSFNEEIEYVTDVLGFKDAQSTTLASGNQKMFVIFKAGGGAGPGGIGGPCLGYSTEEILMTGVRPDCVRVFTDFENGEEHRAASADALEKAKSSFMNNIVKTQDSIVDEFWFDPCGYSANVIIPGAEGDIRSAGCAESDYFSTHISPEPVTSFASLELGSQIYKPSLEREGMANIHSMVPAFTPKNIFHTALAIAQVGTTDAIRARSFVDCDNTPLYIANGCNITQRSETILSFGDWELVAAHTAGSKSL